MVVKTDRMNKGNSAFKIITFGVYLPSFFVFASRSLFIPLIPLYAMELGASEAAASLIMGLSTISQLLIDFPSGYLMEKIGEKLSMQLSVVLYIVAVLISGIFHNLLFLALTLFLQGFATSMWLISVMSYIRKHSAVSNRGRFLSGVGGIMRLGRIISPVVAGYIAESFGYFYLFFISATFFSVALGLTFIVPYTRIRTVKKEVNGDTCSKEKFGFRTLITVIRDSKDVLLSTGVTMLVLGMIRNSYQIVLPIFGKSVGLSMSYIGSIMGLLSAGGLLMVIPAGFVMDKLGRKWSLGICMVAISLGMGLMPIFNSVTGYIVLAALVGIGNGMGSGINMTIGSDVARGKNIGAFLGLWRLLSDTGRMSAPLLLGLFTGIFSFGLSMIGVSIIGLAGALFMFFNMHETLDKGERDVTNLSV